MPLIDPARLYSALLNTGLQTRDNPLYQVIYQMIGTIIGLNGNVNGIISIPPASNITNIQNTIINSQQRFNEQPRSPWPLFQSLSSSSSGITSPEVPIVVTTNTVIDTNFGEVIPESLEIASGIQLEIQGGARLEITGQVSSVTAPNLGQSIGSTIPVVATAIPLSTFRNFACHAVFASTTSNIGWSTNPTATGTQTFVIDSRGNWERLTAASGAANPSALSETTDFLRLENNIELLVHFRLGSDITNQRFWIGFWTNAASDADVNVRPGCGVRYSTVAGDTGFVLQTSDGTSQNLGATLGTAVANDEYLIHLIIGGGGLTLTVYLEQLSTGLTTSGQISILRTALGQNMFAFQVRLINQAAGTRFFDIERASIYWGFQMSATVQ